MNTDFYEQLINSSTFCEKLGRLTLLANKLESVLKTVIYEAGIEKNLSVATLGKLKAICAEHQLVNSDILSNLQFIHDRRNYLIHRLFPLFNGELEETLLPKNNLCEIDAEHYFPNCVDSLISYVEHVFDELSHLEKHA